MEIDGAAQALPDTPARVDNRSVLFNTTSLSNSPHVLKVSNADGWLLLDEFTTTVPVAAPGCGIVGDSSLTPSSAFDTKLADDRDPRIKFTGSWTQQTGDNFENKTSTYTSGLNNSFEFVFDGELFRLQASNSSRLCGVGIRRPGE